TVGDRLLPHQRRADRPVVVQVHFQRGACALGVGVVVVLAGASVALQQHAGGAVVGVADGNAGRRVGTRAGLVVDVARIVFAPTHEANGGTLAERNVDHALDGGADATVCNLVGAERVVCRESAGVGRVGDDAQRTGFGAGAIQRTLGSGQHLDAGDVVHVDVDRPLDRGDRLVVEVHADARPRPGIVPAAAAADTAHVDDGKALRAIAATVVLKGHAGQVLHVVLEVLDVQGLELILCQHVDADRHLLQILGAPLRGHRDRTQGLDL